MKNKLPNFLIVGAGKSGTTSLYKYLKQHPDIYMPENKEPCFFVSENYKNINKNSINYENIQRRVVHDFGKYQQLFDSCINEKSRGESSVDYLYSYDIAIKNIKEYLGDVKIIIILRDPVAKAFSNYTHQFELGNETLTFEMALKIEKERIDQGFSPAVHYTQQAFYYEQVKAYLDNFTLVKVCLFDDLKNDPLILIQDIYNFLEVDPSFIPKFDETFNRSGVPKSRIFHNFLMKKSFIKKIIKPLLQKLLPSWLIESTLNYLRNINLGYSLVLDKNTKKELQAYFAEDIKKLETLIDRDLGHWLN